MDLSNRKINLSYGAVTTLPTPQGYQGITGSVRLQDGLGNDLPLAFGVTSGVNIYGPVFISGATVINASGQWVSSMAGFQGVQGPQGWQGPIGPSGSNGTSGNQGFQGPQGNQGFQGWQGVAGATGSNGTSGNQGFQGPQGWQGPAGSFGALTASQVLFGDGTATPAQSSNLLWNNSLTDFEVYGTAVISGATGATAVSRLEVRTNGLGVSQTYASGLTLRNATAGASGAQQISPALRLEGQGFKTAATSASQPVAWVMDALPIQASSAPVTTFRLGYAINNGSITNLLTLESLSGTLSLQNQASGATGYMVVRGLDSFTSFWVNHSAYPFSIAHSGVNGGTTITFPSTGAAPNTITGNNLTITATNFQLGATGLSLTGAGSKIQIATGTTSASAGFATLVAGATVVNTTAVTATSMIQLTVNGGTLTNVGTPLVSSRVAGTSFTITSSNILDTAQVAWLIIEQR